MNTDLFIVSKDISSAAEEKLKSFWELLFFESKNIVYPAIQNHPDIFFTPLNKKSLVCAPNTPPGIIRELQKRNIAVLMGNTPVKKRYPFTAHYNAIVTDKYIVHNKNYTDVVLKDVCAHLHVFNVKQAYCRCNLIALPDKSFLTSDKGIYEVLTQNGQRVLYIDPAPISLKDFSNGFFGGCCGLSDKHFFFNGSLDFMKEVEEIRAFVIKAGLTIVELSDSRPEDIGSLICLKPDYYVLS